VKIRLNGGRTPLLLHSEPRTSLKIIVNLSGCRVPHFSGQSLRRKIDTVVRDAKGNIVGAVGLIQGIAIGPCLRESGGCQDCEKDGQRPGKC
jgi:hypothetical protein